MRTTKDLDVLNYIKLNKTILVDIPGNNNYFFILK